MSSALQSIHSIKAARTDASVALAFTVCIRGPLRVQVDALDDFWARAQAGLLRKRFTQYRLASDTNWRVLPDHSKVKGFAETFGFGQPLVGTWGLELRDDLNTAGAANGCTVLSITDLAPVRGMERLSHLRVLFGGETPVATLTALGEWATTHLPLWWGCAGFVFQHTEGTMFTAHKRMAALAKRYWGVQIQDMTALQWDGLEGMPGINWLTLIGNDFATSKDLSIDALEAKAGELRVQGVFLRRGAHALAVAAGSKPVYGDINVGEDMDAYIRTDRLLRPLLLAEHTPLWGPFAKPKVLNAWLRRFEAPREWLECDIGTE